MRASSIWTCAALGLALLVSSGDALANVDIASGIPNASDCTYCHPDPAVADGPTDLSLFGSEFTGLTIGERTDQARGLWVGGLYADDTDMDGKTNGLELGDPCGTGDAERTTDISNPGDAASITPAEMPAEGCPNAAGSIGAGPATPPPPFTSGICSVQGPLGAGSSLPVWAGLGTAAALGLGFLRARRRQR